VKIPIFMIFSFVMVVATWATKALEDGKISAMEGLDLIGKLASIIGVPLEFDIPQELTGATEKIDDQDLTSEGKTFLSKPDFVEPDK